MRRLKARDAALLSVVLLLAAGVRAQHYFIPPDYVARQLWPAGATPHWQPFQVSAPIATLDAVAVAAARSLLPHALPLASASIVPFSSHPGSPHSLSFVSPSSHESSGNTLTTRVPAAVSLSSVGLSGAAMAATDLAAPALSVPTSSPTSGPAPSPTPPRGRVSVPPETGAPDATLDSSSAAETTSVTEVRLPGYDHSQSLGSLPAGPVTVAWRVDKNVTDLASSTLHVAVRAPAAGYIALAFPSKPGEMIGSEAVVGWLQPIPADPSAAGADAAASATSALQSVRVYRLRSKSSRQIANNAVPLSVGYLRPGASIEQDADGFLVLRFARPFRVATATPGDEPFIDFTRLYHAEPAAGPAAAVELDGEIDASAAEAATVTDITLSDTTRLPDPSLPVLWASGPAPAAGAASTAIGYHENNRGAATLNLVTGTVTKPAQKDEWMPYIIAASWFAGLMALAALCYLCFVPTVRTVSEQRVWEPIALWAARVIDKGRAQQRAAAAAAGKAKAVSAVAGARRATAADSAVEMLPVASRLGTAAAATGGESLAVTGTIADAAARAAREQRRRRLTPQALHVDAGEPGDMGDARIEEENEAAGISSAVPSAVITDVTPARAELTKPSPSVFVRALAAARSAVPNAWAYLTLIQLAFLALMIALLVTFYVTRVASKPVGSDAVRGALGDTTVLCLSFALLAPHRHSVLLMLSGVSWEHAVVWHRSAGRISFVLALAHFFLGPSRITDKLTGFFALSCLFLIAVSSMGIVRRFSYSLFYTLHMTFMTLLLVFVCIHAPTLRTFLVLAIPVIAKAVDWALRAVERGCNRATVLSIRPFANFTELRVRAPKGFKWPAGAYCHLLVPQIDPLFAHPFSIVNAAPDHAASADVAAALKAAARYAGAPALPHKPGEFAPPHKLAAALAPLAPARLRDLTATPGRGLFFRELSGYAAHVQHSGIAGTRASAPVFTPGALSVIAAAAPAAASAPSSLPVSSSGDAKDNGVVSASVIGSTLGARSTVSHAGSLLKSGSSGVAARENGSGSVIVAPIAIPSVSVATPFSTSVDGRFVTPVSLRDDDVLFQRMDEAFSGAASPGLEAAGSSGESSRTATGTGRRGSGASAGVVPKNLPRGPPLAAPAAPPLPDYPETYPLLLPPIASGGAAPSGRGWMLSGVLPPAPPPSLRSLYGADALPGSYSGSAHAPQGQSEAHGPLGFVSASRARPLDSDSNEGGDIYMRDGTDPLAEVGQANSSAGGPYWHGGGFIGDGATVASLHAPGSGGPHPDDAIDGGPFTAHAPTPLAYGWTPIFPTLGAAPAVIAAAAARAAAAATSFHAPRGSVHRHQLGTPTAAATAAGAAVGPGAYGTPSAVLLSHSHAADGPDSVAPAATSGAAGRTSQRPPLCPHAHRTGTSANAGAGGGNVQFGSAPAGSPLHSAPHARFATAAAPVAGSTGGSMRFTSALAPGSATNAGLGSEQQRWLPTASADRAPVNRADFPTAAAYHHALAVRVGLQLVPEAIATFEDEAPDVEASAAADSAEEAGPVLTFYIKSMGSGTWSGALNALARALQVSHGNAITSPLPPYGVEAAATATAAAPHTTVSIDELQELQRQHLTLPQHGSAAGQSHTGIPGADGAGMLAKQPSSATSGSATTEDGLPLTRSRSGGLDGKENDDGTASAAAAVGIGRSRSTRPALERPPAAAKGRPVASTPASVMPALDVTADPPTPPTPPERRTLSVKTLAGSPAPALDSATSLAQATAAKATTVGAHDHALTDTSTTAEDAAAAAFPGVSPFSHVSPFHPHAHNSSVPPVTAGSAVAAEAPPSPPSRRVRPSADPALGPLSLPRARSVHPPITLAVEQGDGCFGLFRRAFPGQLTVRLQAPLGGTPRLQIGAEHYRNLVFCVGGVGVTPALALVQRLHQAMVASRARSAVRRLAAGSGPRGHPHQQQHHQHSQPPQTRGSADVEAPATAAAGASGQYAHAHSRTASPVVSRPASRTATTAAAQLSRRPTSGADWVSSGEVRWSDRRVLLIWAVRDIELLYLAQKRLRSFALKAEWEFELERTHAGRHAAAGLAPSPSFHTVALDDDDDGVYDDDAGSARRGGSGGLGRGRAHLYAVGFIQILVFYTGTALRPGDSDATAAGEADAPQPHLFSPAAFGSGTARSGAAVGTAGERLVANPEHEGAGHAGGVVPDLSGVAAYDEDEDASSAVGHRLTRTLYSTPPARRQPPQPYTRPAAALPPAAVELSKPAHSPTLVPPDAALPAESASSLVHPLAAHPHLAPLPPTPPPPHVPHPRGDGLCLRALAPSALEAAPSRFGGGYDVVVGRPRFRALIDAFLQTDALAAARDAGPPVSLLHGRLAMERGRSAASSSLTAGAATGEEADARRAYERAVGLNCPSGACGVEPAETAVFLCGPDAMADDVRRAALERGIPVHAEQFYL